VPARGAQTAEDRLRRRRFVEMEGLRIELPSEFDDRLGRDRRVAVLDDFTGRKVLEIEPVHRLAL